VRRALEQDAAFEISAMTSPSRGITATLGSAVDLDDPAARERVDVLVIGAPSAASPAALARAARFARERGGAVVVLADVDAGPAAARLTGVDGWRRRTLAAPADAAGAHGALRAAELLVAPPSPAGVTLASLATGEPIVEDIPLGAGRVIISGAIDAWRYRRAGGEAFARFWRAVIGDAAEGAAPPLTVRAQRAAVSAGDTVTVEVAVRDARPGHTIEARVSLAGEAPAAIRLWPSSSAGVFTGRLRAPSSPGTYRIDAQARIDGGSALTASTAVYVPDGNPIPVGPHQDVVLAALASTHGGAFIESGSADVVRAALDTAFPAHRADVAVHPMRSPWWLLPFVLLLSLEWKWRRENGLR
jgi:hypothetical protein